MKTLPLLVGSALAALIMAFVPSSGATPPTITPDGLGAIVSCDDDELVMRPIDTSNIYVECVAPDEEQPPPVETSTPPAPIATKVVTPTVEPPIGDNGDVGLYPNCIAPAIALETHTWWHEDGAATNDINHMHLGTCYPNARPDGSVKVNGTLEVPVRVVLYNYPTTIDFVRYQWQGDTQQVNDIDFSCGGDYEQCIGWTTLEIDTSQQNRGVDELRMSPNIGSNPFGARHFITLNFQSDNGGNGSYRNSVEPIARSWYSGGSYLRVQWSNYMNLFSSADQTVPTVSGNVEIDVRHSGDGCDVSTGYVDPAFHAFHAGNAAEPVPFYEVNSCFDGNQTLDTTGLSNGIHTVYLQSCGDRGTGNLCTAMAYQIDVQN